MADPKAKSNQSKRVFAELVSAVDSSVIVQIMGTASVFHAWEALQERLATQSVSHAVVIGKKLRAKEFWNEDIAEYLHQMRRMYQDLEAAGSTMHDELVKVLLTNVNAEHLETLVAILRTSSMAGIGISEVRGQLLLEDEHRRGKKNASRGEALLSSGDKLRSRPSSHGNWKDSKREETRRCFKCDMQGTNCAHESGVGGDWRDESPECDEHWCDPCGDSLRLC